MPQVIVSNKYQILIPREIRKSHNIQKGQKVSITDRGGHIEIVTLRDISEMRGFLRGMSSDGIREEEDEDRV